MRWLLAVSLVGCAAGDDVPAPRLASVVPDHAAPGTIISIGGSALCQIAHQGDDGSLVCPNAGTVAFGSYPATATSWTDDAITVEVPAAPPGPARIRVQVKGRASNSIEFVVE